MEAAIVAQLVESLKLSTNSRQGLLHVPVFAKIGGIEARYPEKKVAQRSKLLPWATWIKKPV
ncbi:MAG: hypothetical protein ABIQ93_08365 [Saprospiraceae bacterium]